jgi:hypothetical protein
MAQIAVIIPAIKPDFLAETLQSLIKQPRERFSVHVCDDGGPEEIAKIVAIFSSSLTIKYTRYSNIGSVDVVSHWNRSVRTTNEEWVWLFSDDDVLEPDTIASVSDAITKAQAQNLFRIQSSIIDAQGRILHKNPPHPPWESVEDFAYFRLKGQRASFVPDYIFKRSTFEAFKGFTSFPKAWCSDDASWVKFGEPAGITTVQGGRLFWRHSDKNISRNTALKLTDPRLASTSSYIEWLDRRFGNKPENFMDELRKLYVPYYIRQMLNTRAIGKADDFLRVQRLARVTPRKIDFFKASIIVAARLKLGGRF